MTALIIPARLGRALVIARRRLGCRAPTGQVRGVITQVGVDFDTKYRRFAAKLNDAYLEAKRRSIKLRHANIGRAPGVKPEGGRSCQDGLFAEPVAPNLRHLRHPIAAFETR